MERVRHVVELGHVLDAAEAGIVPEVAGDPVGPRDSLDISLATTLCLMPRGAGDRRVVKGIRVGTRAAQLTGRRRRPAADPGGPGWCRAWGHSRSRGPRRDPGSGRSRPGAAWRATT